MSQLNDGTLTPVVTPSTDVHNGMRPEVILAGAGGSSVPSGSGGVVSGLGYTSSLTTTRPENTTAYTAGDVVGAGGASPQSDAGSGVLTFANIGPANGHIIITDTDFLIKVASVPSGMTSFRLHLYNATPPSAFLDNDVWSLPAGDVASYLGYIDLGTPVAMAGAANLFVQTSGINKKLLMGATTSLFGYKVTNGGYTPTSAAVKILRLNAIGV